MKRTLFGMLVMGSIVAMGSAGVYFAQKHLAPKIAQAEQPEQAENKPRDLTPVPIPIARAEVQSDEASPGAGNPFVGGGATAAVVDRYQTAPEPLDETPAAQAQPLSVRAEVEPTVEATDYDAQEVAEVGEVADSQDVATDDYAGDQIPDANQLAGYDEPTQNVAADDPYGAPAPRGSRYSEQPAAAEIVEDAAPVAAGAAVGAAAGAIAAEAAGEPRRLTADDPAAGDRYAAPEANPLRSNSAERYAAPPEERYAAEEYPQTEAAAPAAQPYPATPEPRAMALDGSDTSFAPQTAGEGTGRPGDPTLSGSQAPALTIEKTAPPEIQIGKPAKFVIKVTNSGNAAAHEVEIHDTVPQGTQLLDTAPPAKAGPSGALVWQLGTLKPGDEKSVELQLMPTSEGEVGSVATVHFHAEASVRTLVTKPILDIEVFGPSQVHKDEQVVLRIKLSNPGSGAANGIVLTETVPSGLKHEEGKELELDLGTLKPGESRELDLALVAIEAGMTTNVVTATAEGNLRAEARTEIDVVAPELQVAMTGPKRRYLERNATHNILISNPGTAPAKDVDLVAVLPRTLQFVSANNGGHFDEATHAVYWNLEELPPSETGTVKLTTLPLAAGEAKVLIKSSSKDGLSDEREETVEIEGLAAINFQLSDLKDPIEVGAETAYEIRITNQGTAAASNVRLAALLPRGMQPLSAEAPVRYKIEGQRVVFEPIRQLAPKADTSLTIKVKAIEAGDQRVEVQVATDEIRDPISKEESTRVYGDE